MKKTDLRKVLAAVSVVSVAAGLVLAAGCKSSCSGGLCSGSKPATSTDTQPKSPASAASNRADGEPFSRPRALQGVRAEQGARFSSRLASP